MMFDIGAESVRSNPGPENGEVFTRRWVVELILDLAGYTADRDLATMTAVEPSCGTGAFLGPMVERLVVSARQHGHRVEDAAPALRAYELLAGNAELARKRVVAQLAECDVGLEAADALATTWVRADDFLLTAHVEGSADFVLGNPPYIRLENVPGERKVAYRRACATMVGRSDVFIGFIEMGLRLLRSDGVLGFIVADRWMRNQYGVALRSFVGRHFAVDAVIEMHDVDAFEEEVSAYPAVTVIRRQARANPVVASTTSAFNERDADEFKRWFARQTTDPFAAPSVHAARLPGWFSPEASWPSAPAEKLEVLADLEHRYPPLEDLATGTSVGIGLATGADDVYLTRDTTVAEPERLLPVVMAKDLTSGRVSWSGVYLVNPWDDSGLVDLDEWPILRAYLERHASRVRSRYIASMSPARWYRTIDRMTSGLLARPKLLLPEMKASAHPVLDDGAYYPHHNLYHVTSTHWDLEVLGGLLLSEVANLFVGSYCVKMRGGTYRFQAQYLRRIRVPAIESVKRSDRRALASAFQQRDVEAATGVAVRLYGLDRAKASLFGQRN